MVEAEGQGREEYESECESGADEEEILERSFVGVLVFHGQGFGMAFGRVRVDYIEADLTCQTKF